MKKLLISVIVIGLSACCILMNSSCANKNLHPEKTKALDSIALVVFKTDSALALNDTIHMRKCIDHIFVTLELVQKNITDGKDTVSKGAAEILRTFNGIRWKLQTILGRQPVLLAEMKKSEEQLHNLSHDIKLNHIPADSVNIYFSLEMKKARELVETAQQGFNLLNMQLPMYDLVVPKADSLINRLNRHEGI